MFALLVLLATLNLTGKDNGKTFTVQPQKVIVVTLVSNRSTGYQWRYVRTAGNPKVVKVLSHRYVARPGVGAAGKEIWRFRAVGAGTAKIDLQYIRPFQPQQVAHRFGVTIDVS
jgi:predicted secreted protein